jgi:hypothetical protein
MKAIVRFAILRHFFSQTLLAAFKKYPCRSIDRRINHLYLLACSWLLRLSSMFV